MRTSIFALAAITASATAQQTSSASATASTSVVPLSLGSQCESDAQCGDGVQCFGSTAFTIKTCGSYNAACVADSQCATNTCGNGICSGPLASSLWRIPADPTASISAGGYQPAPTPTIIAAAGSLQLGAQCANDEQCAAGVQCFGSTAGTIRTCGSYNAACSSDSQCATNTCGNGICSGPLASSLWRIPAASTSTSARSTLSTASPTSHGNGTSTNTTASHTPSVFAGGASKAGVGAAAVAAAVGFAYAMLL